MRTIGSNWLVAMALTLAFTAAVATPIDDVGPDGFRLMSPAEEAVHRRQMSRLSGDARARYRDAQWRRLRERAAGHGYLMPETPPWPLAKPKPATRTARPSLSDETHRPDTGVTGAPNFADRVWRQPPPGSAPPGTGQRLGPSDRREAARRRQHQRDARPQDQEIRRRLEDARRAELRARIDRALDRFSAPLPDDPPALPAYDAPRPPPQ